MRIIFNLFRYKAFNTLLLLLIVLEQSNNVVNAIADQPLLLLISLDGLNHRHVNPKLTPRIWELAQNGVLAAKGIKVQFTTVTAPNHHSIVTGLYEETHGILDNNFYDPEFKEHFDIWNFWDNKTRSLNSLAAKWYQAGEPIWLTNMKQPGRLSGTYLWPMGEALIDGGGAVRHRVKPWSNYTNEGYKILPSEIDELLQWFLDESQPINLGLYYNAEPDHTEHSNDLWGSNVTHKLLEVDSMIGRLIDESKRLDLFDKLNIILTADHGHATVESESFTFNMSEYINKDRVINSSYSFFARTELGVTDDEIYANLSRAVKDGLQVQVYRKKDFPDRYHWANNRRIGPNILIYNYHYWAASNSKPYPHGVHGYLNDYSDMNAFFVAHGPAFKRGYVIDTDYIENIDIYPLMCHVLGVEPAPNNGSLDRISIILQVEPGRYMHNPMIVWFIIFSIIVPFFATFFYCMGLCCCCNATGNGMPRPGGSSKYEKLKLENGNNSSKAKRTYNNTFNSLQTEKYGSSNDEL